MSNSGTIGQRFSQLIQALGMSKNAFAISLEKTATVIQHIVDERNKPGYDLLCKVFEIYPNVSKEWLMLGQGAMVEMGSASPAGPPLVGSSTAAATTAPLPAEDAKPLPAASAEPQPAAPANPAPATEPVATTLPTPPVTTQTPAPETPTPAPAPTPASTPAPAPAEAAWQTALYTQQMAHQLAMAELRNQHLLEQQRLMQQMLELMQRKLS